jgi:hypothetical protein
MATIAQAERLLSHRTASPSQCPGLVFRRALRPGLARCPAPRLASPLVARAAEPSASSNGAPTYEPSASMASIDESKVQTRFIAETLLPTRHGKFRLRGYKHSVGDGSAMQGDLGAGRQRGDERPRRAIEAFCLPCVIGPQTDGGATFTEPTAIVAGVVEGKENVSWTGCQPGRVLPGVPHLHAPRRRPLLTTLPVSCLCRCLCVYMTPASRRVSAERPAARVCCFAMAATRLGTAPCTTLRSCQQLSTVPCITIGWDFS